MSPTICLVAAEPSGDLLGARLLQGLKARYPSARFVGVGGPRMAEEGFDSWIALDELSVMGLVEVLRHLPRLLKLRRSLQARIERAEPDIMVGIDAPDFNLTLERNLRAKGIPTVHYVSPTVWAWREKRVKKIRAAADKVLALLPFEPDFLARHGIDATYVGHPLAEQMPLQEDRAAARRELDLPAAAPVLALLPGSRMGELQRHAATFLAAARYCVESVPDLRVLVPLATERTGSAFAELVREHAPDLPLSQFRGRARTLMTAADVVLTASGTASLEAMFCHRPMVVGYRLAPMTAQLMATFSLLKTRYVALPNLLSPRALAPELLHAACTPRALADQLLALLGDAERRRLIEEAYRRAHEQLLMPADTAAQAVAGMLGRA